MIKVLTYLLAFAIGFMIVGWPLVFIAIGCFMIGAGHQLAKRSGS